MTLAQGIGRSKRKASVMATAKKKAAAAKVEAKVDETKVKAALKSAAASIPSKPLPAKGKGQASVSEPAKAKAQPKAPTAKRAVPVRVESKYAGSTLIPKVKLEESRRITGSTRYKSLNLITASPKGIKYEDYRKAGGVGRYVTWFLKRDHIEVKSAK